MNYSISPGYNSFPVNSNSDMWVGPWPQYGQYRHLENPDGLDQIRQDFAAIRGLGFNSIRLITGLKGTILPMYHWSGSYCHPVMELLAIRYFHLIGFFPAGIRIFL